MVRIIQSGSFRRASALVPINLVLLAFFCFFPFPAFSQNGPTCSASSDIALVHAEGLAEQIANFTLTCTGGTPGSLVAAAIFITLNTNITNRIDGSGNLLFVTVTANTGLGGPVPTGTTPTLYSPVTLAVEEVQYTVPNPSSQPVTMLVSGIRTAMPDIVGGGALVTGTVLASGVGIVNRPPTVLASGHPSLLDSVINNGIPCGSPAPATLDFPGLLAAGTYSSTVRVTEGYVSAFLPKSPTADTGVRILVNLSGFGSNTQVYVPDAIVGDTGATPTSAGAFDSTYSGGVYAPGSKQLLLVLVNGADATGLGGTLALATPGVATTFASVTGIAMPNGAGYAVYEVVDSNPNLLEWAQIPVFLSIPLASCPTSGQPALAPEIAPVSNVAVATQTDPIPRFIASTPSPDCQQVGDCGAAYFPQLTVLKPAISLNGSSLGLAQTASDQVINAGAGQLTFSVSTAYQSAADNWLSVTPSSGTNNTLLTLTANPASLIQGVYQATVTINAGTAGTATVKVTFNVGAPAPELQVLQNSVALTASVAGTSSSTTVKVVNVDSQAGQMTFTVYTEYQYGFQFVKQPEWLSISPASGTDSTTLTLTASPDSLAAGVYQALVTIDAGSAGSASIEVTFDVTVTTPLPAIQSVVNAANFQPGPIAAGSFAAIYGLNLVAAKTISVTFNGLPANVSYDGQPSPSSATTQINVLLPAALGTATTANAVAIIDGRTSNSFAVALAADAPAVFTPGILNQDNSVNLPGAPSAPGQIVQIFLTGLTTPIKVPVTVSIGGQIVSNPAYVGPVASITGLEQVNVEIPAGLNFSGNSVPLAICIPGTGSQPLCSAAVDLYLNSK